MNVQQLGHTKPNDCPFRLTCENCFLELTIYVPNQYSIEEYIEITQPFLTNQLKTITKQKDNLYMLETNGGQTLKNASFELTYICKLGIENKQQTIQQPQSTCPSYVEIEEEELSIKTIIYKKTSTNQEVKIRPERLDV